MNKSGSFGLDTLGAIITIDTPAAGSIAACSPVQVVVSGSIDNSGADVTVNGVAATVVNGVYTAMITLSSSNNVITVEADDGAYVTTLTRIVTFDGTAPFLILDDFEDNAKRIGEWWDKDGSIVYKRYIGNDKAKDGARSLHVEYHKFTGYENSAFGAKLIDDGITNNLTHFDQVRFWLYTADSNLSIKLSIEDSLGGLWEKTLASTVQNDWQEFVYDFSGTAIIDFTNVKNIFFTVNPGDNASQGSFSMDGLCLVSTRSYITVAANAPVLSGPQGPDIYDAYTLSWTNVSSSGGTIYELLEDADSGFTSPAVYWLNDLSIGLEGRVVPETYHYKVRAWSTSLDEGGVSGSFSNTVSVIIKNMPPEISAVNSFTSSGDNDNSYEKGILVNINAAEAHKARDIEGGTVRITSTSANYDSGIKQLSPSEDGTYWTYAWDTKGLTPAADYEVNTSLKDLSGQEDTDGLGVQGADITIALKEATAPLLSKLLEDTDLSYPARGMSVKITRVYDHSLQDEEPFGKGWTHSFIIRLKEYAGGRVDFVMGNGAETSFTPLGGGAYANKPGVHDKLTKNQNGTYTIRKKSGTLLNFDTAGRLITIVDTNNNTITLAYDSNNRLESITDPSGGEYTFVYKTWSAVIENTSKTYTRLDYVEDPANRRVTYGYDETYGELTSVADVLSAVTSYGYTETTRKLSSITYPGGGHKYFTYYSDEYGRLKSECADNEALKRTYIYEEDEPVMTVRDYYNKDTVIHFNDFGRTVSITDALNKTTTYAWDNDLNRTNITDPEGNETDFTYDDMGNMLSVTRTKNGTVYTTAYAYDRRESRRDDETYNKVAAITDTKGRLTTEFDYDPQNGNLLSITNKIPDKQNYVTSFAYDAYGRLKTKTDAKNHITKYTYYNNGLLKEENKEESTAVIYTTAYTYDIYGNPASVTDAEGNTTTYTYNALDQLLETEDANLHSTAYTYDRNGNLKTITDAKNHTTVYNYDLVDELTSIVYKDGSNISYTCDKMSNLITKQDQNNKTTAYTYDNVYRLTRKQYHDTTAVTYAYYDDGALKDVTDSSGTIHYDYDEWNELTQVTYPGSIAVSYAYDELGNRVSMTYPSGKVVDYTYDIMNRLKTVTLEGALEGAAPGAAAYTWNALSQREQLELPNGSKAVYTYDALNRLESLTNSTSADNVIAAFAYTHDKVGNRKTMIDPEGPHQYNYDNTYQLTGVDYPAKPDQGYAYDPAGNRETVTEGGAPAAYTTDNMNRYTAVDITTYGYDNNGCLTSKTDAGGTTTYQYDYENRLISYTLSIGGEGRGEGVYTYDYLGRRIKVNNNSTITCYVYDNNRVIAEYNSTGLICEYVYGNNIDEVLFMVKGSGFYYYHYDGLGSVRAITDDAGATIETCTYDVYGKPTIYDATHTKIPQSQFGNRFYFTGREFDKETGLYYYRARYYDPTLGRFMSPDPVGPVDGPNLYTYCGNDSVNYLDSLGLMSGKERNDWLRDKLKKKNKEKKKTSSIGQQIKDFILPPAEARLDLDQLEQKLDEKERKGEPWNWGDELDTKDVKEAENNIKELGKRLINTFLRALGKLLIGI